MFDKVQHIGYLVADLDKVVTWFKQRFGAENAGGGPVRSSQALPGGGRNTFVPFGRMEAERVFGCMDMVGWVDGCGRRCSLQPGLSEQAHTYDHAIVGWRKRFPCAPHGARAERQLGTAGHSGQPA